MGIKVYIRQIESAIETIQISLDGIYQELDNVKYKRKRMKGVIPELADELLNDVLSSCTQELQKDWIILYQDVAWIKAELQKAKVWLTAKNRPTKNMGLFFSKWLSKAKKTKPTDILEVSRNDVFYNPKY